MRAQRRDARGWAPRSGIRTVVVHRLARCSLCGDETFTKKAYPWVGYVCAGRLGCADRMAKQAFQCPQKRYICEMLGKCAGPRVVREET